VQLNAITVPSVVEASNAVGFGYTSELMVSLSILNDSDAPVDFLVSYGCSIKVWKVGYQIAQASGSLLIDGVVKSSSEWIWGYSAIEVAVGHLTNKITIPANTTVLAEGRVDLTTGTIYYAERYNRFIQAIGLKR
jgi:hypothetical protein